MYINVNNLSKFRSGQLMTEFATSESEGKKLNPNNG